MANNTLNVLTNRWISDDTITFFFDILTNLLINNITTYLMNPNITNVLTNLTDYQEYMSLVEIENKENIITVINDCDDTKNGGDSHSSTLVYQNKENTFYYYDLTKNTVCRIPNK